MAERLLILGSSPLAAKIIEEIEARRSSRYVIAGVAAEEGPAEGLHPSAPLLGPLDLLDRIAEEARADRIVVAIAQRRGRLPLRQLLQARLAGIDVEEGEEFYERLTGKIAIEALTPGGIIYCHDLRTPPLTLAPARAFSVAAAAVALVLLAPL